MNEMKVQEMKVHIEKGKIMFGKYGLFYCGSCKFPFHIIKEATTNIKGE